MFESQPILLDCTLRDGGYYTSWDFDHQLVEDYLRAMSALNINYVELGFRTLKKDGFKGPCAYTTDTFVSHLTIPPGMKLGVMLNASELVSFSLGPVAAVQKLFKPAVNSPISFVRIACHYEEFDHIVTACDWLKKQGYFVGVNVMQIPDRSLQEIKFLGQKAPKHCIDILCMADSFGNLKPDQIEPILSSLRTHWNGEIGIHAHDNMGNALANTLSAFKAGARWLDCTVTGMGRGPGNTKTEYLAIELINFLPPGSDITALLNVIRNHFKLLQDKYIWGTNAYYYLLGKYGIHPTYVQVMLTDTRYSDADILAVIEYLQKVGGKKYNAAALEAGRNFYEGSARGTWSPKELICNREVLIIATGPGVRSHKQAIEDFILSNKPFVIALNTQNSISTNLIDIRAACHPVRLLADCEEYSTYQQPLATPASMLPDAVRDALTGTVLLDFGIEIREGVFEFHNTYCALPASMVAAYALAIATCGECSKIFLAGFDGYGEDDPRNSEVEAIFSSYMQTSGAKELISITSTRYRVKKASVYQLIENGDPNVN